MKPRPGSSGSSRPPSSACGSTAAPACVELIPVRVLPVVLVLLASLPSLACGTKKPVLYPNATVQNTDPVRVEADL